MKLLTKLFSVTDAEGNELDLEDIPVEILRNGKSTGKNLMDLMHDYAEFDEGEVYGQSLLGYYTVQEDGSLFVTGSHVQLRNAETQEIIKVVKIQRPTLNDDCHIPFETVREFVETFNVEKPWDVFPGLNDEELDVLKADREVAEAKTRKEKDDAEKQLQEAEAARKAKELEDEDKSLRDNLKQVHDEKGFRAVQQFYKDKGCKEYVKHPYHVFFGAESDEDPCLLIKRGSETPEAPSIKNWWHEPEQTAYEEGKTITIEFDDLGKQRDLVFDSETGDIKLTD